MKGYGKMVFLIRVSIKETIKYFNKNKIEKNLNQYQ